MKITVTTRVLDNITYYSNTSTVLSVPRLRKIRGSLKDKSAVIVNTDGSNSITTTPAGRRFQEMSTAWCLEDRPDFYGVEAMVTRGPLVLSVGHVEAYAVFSFLTRAQMLMPSLEERDLVFRLDNQGVVDWGNAVVEGRVLTGDFVDKADRQVRHLFLDALTVLLHRNHYRISFEWIPSHQGIIGNERADYLSRLSRGEVASMGTLNSLEYISFLHQRTNIHPRRMVKVSRRKAVVRPGTKRVAGPGRRPRHAR